MLSRVFSKIRSRSFEQIAADLSMRLFMWRGARRNPYVAMLEGKRVPILHRGTFDDLLAIWQCFDRDQYQVPVPLLSEPWHRDAVLQFYRSILDRGEKPLIVDCGGNIGAGSLALHARYPEAHFVVVEPLQSNVTLLRQNLVGISADIVEAAAADVDGELSLFNPFSNGSTLAFTVGDASCGDGVVVRSMTIRSIIDASTVAATPFILKVDIEGAEDRLFRQDLETLERFPVIIVEPHDFMQPGLSPSANLLAFHSARRRDFLFREENIFSIDLHEMKADRLATSSTGGSS